MMKGGGPIIVRLVGIKLLERAVWLCKGIELMMLVNKHRMSDIHRKLACVLC